MVKNTLPKHRITVVTKDLKNIFETKELDPNSVSAKIAHTAADGKTYNTHFVPNIYYIWDET